ncbi:hypothetical protein NA56DRAFT_651178 [Hyaloscypha hepaticicola]|uniref:Uncharacterized protein n=1 Tax=Hyaloscypha hepaticicola TaxID=2082293 RepID=A0A2J6PJJ5_9HELO|nr:hypothetical protein NA56DRAFT_651178 [Hyaloscypha hepaticicola]
MSECGSVPVLRESKQNLPAMQMRKNNASCVPFRGTAQCDKAGGDRGWWRVGTGVEGFVRSWLGFKVTQSFISNTGEDEARFYEFLSFKDRPQQGILNGPGSVPTTAHMRGRSQDSVQNLAGRGCSGGRSTQNEEKVRHTWLCSPHVVCGLSSVPKLRVAAASLSRGYASKKLLAVAR